MNCLVLLCGCGHIDGSEIRESVLVMLELDRLGIEFSCCSLDKEQVDVCNHITRAPVGEKRNILVESARISRGEVIDITKVDTSLFNMLILPGGLGVAKNFSDLLETKGTITVDTTVKQLILDFHSSKKPIGAVCIAPAIVAASLKDVAKVKVTLGDSSNADIISRAGGEHVPCKTSECVVDTENRVFSCPAYMRDDRIYNVYMGIRMMVESMVNSCKGA